MTNKKILDIGEAFFKVGQLKGPKFVYAIARNVNILRPILEKYSEDRKALLESFAEKNEKGESILLDDKDQFGNPSKRYDIKDMNPYNEKLEELLKEEVEVKLYRINQVDLPQEITAEMLSGIIDLVDESNEPAGK